MLGIAGHASSLKAAMRSLARWLYLNSKYMSGRLARYAVRLIVRWADRESLVKDADRRIVENLIPGFKSVAHLAKYDFAVEALINSRFEGLPILRMVGSSRDRGAALQFERHKALFRYPHRVLICVPWLRTGGADKVAANLAHALSDLYGPKSVAVLILDYTRAFVKKRYPDDVSSRSWFPKEVPVFDLSDTKKIDSQHRIEMLANLFLAVAPEMIVNVNSETAWECYLRYGKQLSQHIRLAACLFCNDYSPYGAPAGYAVTYFRETLSSLDVILSDQQHFLDKLSQRYCLVSQEVGKLRCIYQPVAPALRAAGDPVRYGRLSSSPAYRRQILWAGRITAQKNPDLLFKLIRRNPSYDFHVYGSREKQYRLPRMRNLFRHGPFSKFDDIPHERFDAFLYTSLWDGLPNILLEAASRGLPIIAPMVGGIGELVTSQTGWPVDGPNDIAAFSDSLRQVAYEFDVRKDQRRIDAMRHLIESRHSMTAFTNSISLLMERERSQCRQLQAS
jgi:glycosyltransferase involved in cell wall biosynthesis